MGPVLGLTNLMLTRNWLYKLQRSLARSLGDHQDTLRLVSVKQRRLTRLKLFGGRKLIPPSSL